MELETISVGEMRYCKGEVRERGVNPKKEPEKGGRILIDTLWCDMILSESIDINGKHGRGRSSFG
jgi:hypothetical protein